MDGESGIRDLDLGRKYGLLIGHIVLETNLVVYDRVGPISRVGSRSALWVEVQTQALPYVLCRVDPDSISRGLCWIRVGFFRVVPSAAHLTQPIWPSIVQIDDPSNPL